MVATTPSGADSGPFWVAPQQGTKAAVADQPAEPTALQPLQNGKTSPQKTGPGTTHRNGSRRWSMELVRVGYCHSMAGCNQSAD